MTDLEPNVKAQIIIKKIIKKQSFPEVPIIFRETINAEKYLEKLIPFLNELTKKERQHGYFQRESPYTANIFL